MSDSGIEVQAPPSIPTLAQVEREHILKTLSDLGGDKGTTAEVLGICPKTLYNKLKLYKEQNYV